MALESEYKVESEYEIDTNQKLVFAWSGVCYVVKIEHKYVNGHTMLTTLDHSVAERFFDLIKAAYEELTY